MTKKIFIFIFNTIFVFLTTTTVVVCADSEISTEENQDSTDSTHEAIGAEIQAQNDASQNDMNLKTRQQNDRSPANSIQNDIANDINNSISNNDNIRRFEYKSLMFNKKNIDDIFRLLQRIGKGASIVDNFLFGDDSDKQLVDENNIAIYLNSIMYISKNNWAIWLNGSKITNLNNGEGEVIVTAISPLKASLVWTVDNARWDIINANKNMPANRYKLTDKGVNIYFSLSPNQTFIPSLNKIIEGKIKIEEPEEEENDNNDHSNNDNRNRDNNNQNGNRNNNINDKNNPGLNDFSRQDSLFF